jgi:hypothetical protein
MDEIHWYLNLRNKREPKSERLGMRKKIELQIKE